MVDTKQIRQRIDTVRSFAPWPGLRDDTLALCDEVDRLRAEVEAVQAVGVRLLRALHAEST